MQANPSNIASLPQTSLEILKAFSAELHPLSDSVGKGKTLYNGFTSLTLSQRNTLEKKVGRENLETLLAISQSSNPKRFWKEILIFAKDLKRNYDIRSMRQAARIFEVITAGCEGVSEGLRREAQLELDAINGVGEGSRYAEVKIGTLFKTIFDGRVIAPVVATPLVGSLFNTGARWLLHARRLATGGKMLADGMVGGAWYTRGLTARLISAGAAFPAETLILSQGTRLLYDLTEGGVSWNGSAVWDSTVFGALNLLGAKGFYFLGGRIFSRVAGTHELLLGASSTHRALHFLTTQTSGYLGLLVPHLAMEGTRWIPPLPGNHPGWEALHTHVALQFGIGGARLLFPRLNLLHFQLGLLGEMYARGETRATTSWRTKIKNQIQRLPQSARDMLPRVELGTTPSGNAFPMITFQSEPVQGMANPNQPRIAIIGGGISGLFAALSLTTKLNELVTETRGFRPKVTLFTSDLGGKVQPRNEGGQFVDAEKSFPLVPWIHELGIETLVRPDYDIAKHLLPSGRNIQSDHAIELLRMHRKACRQALLHANLQALDRIPVEEFIPSLPHSRDLMPEEVEALEVRMGVEEGINTKGGTLKESALSYAINMSQGESPMDRLEVVGGPYKMVETIVSTLEKYGVKIHNGVMVPRIDVMEHGVRLGYQAEGRRELLEDMFEGAILAVSPEHYSQIKISFSKPELELPLSAISDLQPSRIIKDNAIIEYEGDLPELVHSKFASWESPLHDGKPGQRMISFFHGMDGERPMTISELMQAAFGENPPQVIESWSRTWDPALQNEVGRRDGYTTVPGVGKGIKVVKLTYRQNLQLMHPGPLWLAAHVLGLSCYMHNAALSGFLAARALLHAHKLPVREFPESMLFGIPLTPELRAQLEAP